ncbi:MAG: hypothetical protein QOK02_3654 [Mycobacterium sp.]|jgi:hypothetical protein|nr:hypothetical protein [Mycobacterium sp.]
MAKFPLWSRNRVFTVDITRHTDEGTDMAAQDDTLDFTVPKRPIRKVHKGIPTFTTLRGHCHEPAPTTRAMSLGRQWRSAGQHLLDVELSLGFAT